MNAEAHILVVEDSPTQAARLCYILEAQNWTTVWAPTAQRAIAEIERRRPDLALLDYYLPGIRGDELCRRIRANINTRGLPMIMLTAEDEPNVELRGLESGADDFVAKSFDPDVLLLRIRALLSKASSQAAVVGQSTSTFQRARILAIDDSLTFLEHLAGELAEEGYEVQQAVSGKEGLERACREPFDCVLVDLVMPEIDGIEVCRAINRMREQTGSTVTVLMLTGQESKEDLTRALEAGADDFVGKSSDLAVLKGRIGALLRRKFFQEENRRIVWELKNKELETAQAKAAAEAAEARATLCDELEKYAAELQRSNGELEQFAYVVSHDLKEPLRMVSCYTSLLAEEFEPLLSEETRGYVHFVTDGARRMAQLIDDLLNYSRIGRGEACQSKVELQKVAEQVLEDLRVARECAAADVVVNPLPEVQGSPLLLRQLLQNLLGNALKFHGAESPLVIVSCDEQEDCWRLSVADNGIGIPQEQQQRVFQIFQRLHTREKYEGTGIGLAICEKIAHQHGGRIWIESAVGQGTTFFCTLSKRTAPVPNAEEVALV